MTKGAKKISQKAIGLSIHSPDVLKLTLVDLPGLIKVTAPGQDESIIKDIRELIRKYIEKENCLILAVSPATDEYVNSDALQMAKEVDPNKQRTIGVLTKLDRVERVTEVCAFLENKLYPLKRGYIAVINRSQDEIEKSKPIKEAIKDEAEFIAKEPKYKNLADRMGTPNLRNILARELEECIRMNLPKLRDDLEQRSLSLGEEISEFKKSRPVDELAMIDELRG